ncbi:MAG TPA: uroporphyrinogen decarboxylase family protein, partial [Elusimicrobiales bacterium]|nr:uroporphyrinogen decarboxylase family protein [Elusimicrobiales bacterium]
MIYDTLDGKKTDRTPFWFMRQAGRYMAEYRAVREKYSFLRICKTPELAALVTLQPVKKFDLDAAILFSDILLPVEAMGLGLDYSPGPVIVPRVSDMDAVERLRVPSGDEFAFVREAAAAVIGELPKGKNLIGFAGAPFTVAAYMMQGGSRDGFPAVRRAAGTEMFH